MVLLMTVEERFPGVIGQKFDFDGSTGVNQDYVLLEAFDFDVVFKTANFKCVAMEVHGMVVHAFVFHDETVTLSGLEQWYLRRGGVLCVA
jgi:hypothetical protein